MILSQSFQSHRKTASKSDNTWTHKFSPEKETAASKKNQQLGPRQPIISSSSAETSQSNVMVNHPQSPIISLFVGARQRLFAVHRDTLCKSPFFHNTIYNMYEGVVERISLPNEEPEAFDAVLQYLYSGDYYPRLVHNEQQDSWELEASDISQGILYHPGLDVDILKDTVVYCSANKYGLEGLKALALRKQALYGDLKCGVVLASARYAYANTPDTEMHLRAHFLTLLVRNRHVFSRSGTMQHELYNGGTLFFFDLFVAMCNFIDDVQHDH
ncbi:hypothetical protein CDD82_4665 [Ophiocordyceps australis]|uniref:BTB domain-containing protein n=1 Tax=Ophiocordyceps australis TaxID=1399860 RepID=A0A2C5ZV40_9HYPO|nr:hypothetical protein CDD82_4665 [Ophiocordyceps australis]